MSEDMKKLVFISHASADASKAGELCKALEDMGFGCWIAPRDIDPGKQYGEEIIHGIEILAFLLEPKLISFFKVICCRNCFYTRDQGNRFQSHN